MSRDESPSNFGRLRRREFLRRSSVASLAGLVSFELAAAGSFAKEAEAATKASIHTVLGPVSPDKLGVTLTHEHAPIVDWSELYETAPAPFASIREEMLAKTAEALDAFHATLSPEDGPGAIVETTPIRVGRYPELLKELAERTKVHIIAATGFWCEALAPQHPWAVRLSVEKGGTTKMAEFYIREITEGMEDPHGKWSQRFTDIKAGIIKVGTSTYLRPSERVSHVAAAIASKETGCPITTHTTNGGGLEEAELLLKHGASPEKIIIGHQGNKDDRNNDEANDYHTLIARLGCYVQLDRVGHDNYGIDKQTRQIKHLIDAGHVKQVLLSHDHVPYVFNDFAAETKTADGWKALDPDYTIVTTQLVESLKNAGASREDIETMLKDNPRRVLAF